MRPLRGGKLDRRAETFHRHLWELLAAGTRLRLLAHGGSGIARDAPRALGRPGVAKY